MCPTVALRLCVVEPPTPFLVASLSPAAELLPPPVLEELSQRRPGPHASVDLRVGGCSGSPEL